MGAEKGGRNSSGEEKQSLPPRLVWSKVSCPLPQAIVVIQREHTRNLFVYEVF